MSSGSDSSTPGGRKPLPKYTSIDLENELPEVFCTSLNPNLRDPDLTLFYNHSGPPFYNYKNRVSPPPSYSSNSRASWSAPVSPSSPSPAVVQQKPVYSYRRFWMLMFFFALIVCPLLILIFFKLIPSLQFHDVHHRVNMSI